MEIQVRTPLIFPDLREALAEFLRSLGYEPSTEEVPRFSLEDVFEPSLTPRQKQFLRLRVKGHTYWEIGDILGGVASGVIRTHVRRIVEKFELHQRSELPRWYMPEAGGSFVLWLGDTVGTATATELAQAVARWMQEHLTHIRRGGTVRLIYGEDDETLAEVPIIEAYDIDDLAD